MRVSEIRLHDFRNYEDLQAVFSDGIHVLAGKNAQGKTNLLEALLYLSTTRSHRTNTDKDLIREKSEAFFIRAKIEKEHKKEDIQITVNEKGKNLFIYQNPVNRVSDFIGEFNAVMFCPDDMSLFNASPRVRRRFVDMELSKISKKYVSTLYVALKLLKERNAYLKQEHVDKAYLEVLTSQLIEEEVVIIQQRHYFLKELLEKCQKFYKELSQDDTLLNISYDSCIPFDEGYPKARSHSCRDFTFMINDKDLATYASQGQKRSVLLALKIGMVYMIRDIIQEFPVLLLDDVFSELDVYRREKLLTSLPAEVQIFISTTDTTEAEKIRKLRKVTLWKVANGTLQRC